MAAQIRRENISLTTYPYSDPAPVPEFGRLYPYNRFDGYTDKGTDTLWEMVVMENKYIKLWVNPAVGGKIWGAIEKVTGKEFIYFNNTAKFRDVAMRGPWTSGGLETNIGIIGHSPSCSSPVDHYIRENKDGSVSCFIGATDWPSRTSWIVEIHLAEEAAYFETRTSWYNNGPFQQSFYNWSNVGVKSFGNLEYIFPGTEYIFHDGKTYSWPADEQDRDLSFYNNNDFGHYKSYHVYGTYNDFWGCYWHQDKFGMGHFAEYDEKPGKKIWIWGLSRYGMLWEDLLTDKDGQYSEVQSGRMFNQSISQSSKTPFKHRSFHPYMLDNWNEAWFPVSKLNGLTYGCKDLSFYYNNQTLEVCANKKIQGRLKIEDGTCFLQEPVQLDPLQTISYTLPKEFNRKKLRLLLDGILLYDAAVQEINLQRPAAAPENFNAESVQALYLQAKEWERQRFYNWAIENYEACLGKDPYYIPALTGHAALMIRFMQYDKALNYLKRALSVDTYDGEANFLYGLVNRKLQFTADAKDGFSIAAQSVEYRLPAYIEMARMLMCEQQLTKATEYLHKAIKYQEGNYQPLQMLLIIKRKQQNYAEAEQLASRLLMHNPLDHIARYEMDLISDKSDFITGITGELAHETIIEIASFYCDLQCWDDALYLLEMDTSHAMCALWKAWVWFKKEHTDKSIICLDKALILNPEFVFPHRPEDAAVLEWACSQQSSWKLNFYLALVYIQMLRSEEAIELLNSCNNEPPFYPFYLVRAQLNKDNDEERKADLLYAVKNAPSSWRAILSLCKYYEEKEEWQYAIDMSESLFKQHPENYYIGLQLAKCYMKVGNFEQSISLLTSLNVLPNEGASEGRNVWRETNLDAALDAIQIQKWNEALLYIDAARSWPENLGVGKPYDTDERLEDYLTLYCAGFTDIDDIELIEERVIGFREKESDFSYGSNDLFTIQLLVQNNKAVEAATILQDWKNKTTDPLPADWGEAFLKKDTEKLQLLDKAEQKVQEALPYEIPYTDRVFPFVKKLYKMHILSNNKLTYKQSSIIAK